MKNGSGFVRNLICLVFSLIAVDFSNGTISLPGTASVDEGDGQFSDWASIQIPEENMTRNGIESIIAAHTDIQEAL